jgi:hypothetical protein
MYCQQATWQQHDTSAGTFNSSTGAWTIGTLTNGSTATASTATVNASGSYQYGYISAEADPHGQQCYGSCHTRSTNNVGITKPSSTTPNVGSNVIFTRLAMRTKYSYNRIGW